MTMGPLNILGGIIGYGADWRRTERDEASEIRNPMLWIHFGTGGKRINCENEGGALNRQNLQRAERCEGGSTPLDNT